MSKTEKHLEYHPNGNKKEEGTYKDGEKDGLWTRFSEYGRKENQMVYNQSKYDYIYLDNGIVSAIQK